MDILYIHSYSYTDIQQRQTARQILEIARQDYSINTTEITVEVYSTLNRQKLRYPNWRIDRCTYTVQTGI